MKIERFEDIRAWQKARELTISIYRLFNSNRDYGFKDQICRASVSIMNNIAEGFEKRGDKELAKYLYIAKGSSAEVRSMLYLAKDLNYLSLEDFQLNYDLTIDISKLLSAFIKTLNMTL